MAGVISSTGTWTTLTDVRAPVEHANGNVEQRFDGSSLNWGTQRVAAANWYPEVLQFIGLASKNGAVTPGIAIDRIISILTSMRQLSDAGEQRVYPTS